MATEKQKIDIETYSYWEMVFLLRLYHSLFKLP